MFLFSISGWSRKKDTEEKTKIQNIKWCDAFAHTCTQSPIRIKKKTSRHNIPNCYLQTKTITISRRSYVASAPACSPCLRARVCEYIILRLMCMGGGGSVHYIPIYISNEMRAIFRRPMRVVFAFHCAPDPNNIHVNNEHHRVTYRASARKSCDHRTKTLM